MRLTQEQLDAIRKNRKLLASEREASVVYAPTRKAETSDETADYASAIEEYNAARPNSFAKMAFLDPKTKQPREETDQEHLSRLEREYRKLSVLKSARTLATDVVRGAVSDPVTIVGGIRAPFSKDNLYESINTSQEYADKLAGKVDPAQLLRKELSSAWQRVNKVDLAKAKQLHDLKIQRSRAEISKSGYVPEELNAKIKALEDSGIKEKDWFSYASSHPMDVMGDVLGEIGQEVGSAALLKGFGKIPGVGGAAAKIAASEGVLAKAATHTAQSGLETAQAGSQSYVAEYENKMQHYMSMPGMTQEQADALARTDAHFKAGLTMTAELIGETLPRIGNDKYSIEGILFGKDAPASILKVAAGEGLGEGITGTIETLGANLYDKKEDIFEGLKDNLQQGITMGVLAGGAVAAPSSYQDKAANFKVGSAVLDSVNAAPELDPAAVEAQAAAIKDVSAPAKTGQTKATPIDMLLSKEDLDVAPLLARAREANEAENSIPVRAELKNITSGVLDSIEAKLAAKEKLLPQELDTLRRYAGTAPMDAAGTTLERQYEDAKFAAEDDFTKGYVFGNEKTAIKAGLERAANSKNATNDQIETARTLATRLETKEQEFNDLKAQAIAQRESGDLAGFQKTRKKIQSQYGSNIFKNAISTAESTSTEQTKTGYAVAEKLPDPFASKDLTSEQEAEEDLDSDVFKPSRLNGKNATVTQKYALGKMLRNMKGKESEYVAEALRKGNVILVSAGKDSPLNAQFVPDTGKIYINMDNLADKNFSIKHLFTGPVRKTKVDKKDLGATVGTSRDLASKIRHEVDHALKEAGKSTGAERKDFTGTGERAGKAYAKKKVLEGKEIIEDVAFEGELTPEIEKLLTYNFMARAKETYEHEKSAWSQEALSLASTNPKVRKLYIKIATAKGKGKEAIKALNEYDAIRGTANDILSRLADIAPTAATDKKASYDITAVTRQLAEKDKQRERSELTAAMNVTDANIPDELRGDDAVMASMFYSKLYSGGSLTPQGSAGLGVLLDSAIYNAATGDADLFASVYKALKKVGKLNSFEEVVDNLKTLSEVKHLYNLAVRHESLGVGITQTINRHKNYPTYDPAVGGMLARVLDLRATYEIDRSPGKSQDPTYADLFFIDPALMANRSYADKLAGAFLAEATAVNNGYFLTAREYNAGTRVANELRRQVRNAAKGTPVSFDAVEKLAEGLSERAVNFADVVRAFAGIMEDRGIVSGDLEGPSGRSTTESMDVDTGDVALDVNYENTQEEVAVLPELEVPEELMDFSDDDLAAMLGLDALDTREIDVQEEDAPQDEDSAEAVAASEAVEIEDVTTESIDIARVASGSDVDLTKDYDNYSRFFMLLDSVGELTTGLPVGKSRVEKGVLYGMRKKMRGLLARVPGNFSRVQQSTLAELLPGTLLSAEEMTASIKNIASATVFGKRTKGRASLMTLFKLNAQHYRDNFPKADITERLREYSNNINKAKEAGDEVAKLDAMISYVATAKHSKDISAKEYTQAMTALTVLKTIATSANAEEALKNLTIVTIRPDDLSDLALPTASTAAEMLNNRDKLVRTAIDDLVGLYSAVRRAPQGTDRQVMYDMGFSDLPKVSASDVTPAKDKGTSSSNLVYVRIDSELAKSIMAAKIAPRTAFTNEEDFLLNAKRVVAKSFLVADGKKGYMLPVKADRALELLPEAQEKTYSSVPMLINTFIGTGSSRAALVAFSDEVKFETLSNRKGDPLTIPATRLAEPAGSRPTTLLEKAKLTYDRALVSYKMAVEEYDKALRDGVKGKALSELAGKISQRQSNLKRRKDALEMAGTAAYIDADDNYSADQAMILEEIRGGLREFNADNEYPVVVEGSANQAFIGPKKLKSYGPTFEGKVITLTDENQQKAMELAGIIAGVNNDEYSDTDSSWKEAGFERSQIAMRRQKDPFNPVETPLSDAEKSGQVLYDGKATNKRQVLPIGFRTALEKLLGILDAGTPFFQREDKLDAITAKIDSYQRAIEELKDANDTSNLITISKYKDALSRAIERQTELRKSASRISAEVAYALSDLSLIDFTADLGNMAGYTKLGAAINTMVSKLGQKPVYSKNDVRDYSRTIPVVSVIVPPDLAVDDAAREAYRAQATKALNLGAILAIPRFSQLSYFAGSKWNDFVFMDRDQLETVVDEGVTFIRKKSDLRLPNAPTLEDTLRFKFQHAEERLKEIAEVKGEADLTRYNLAALKKAQRRLLPPIKYKFLRNGSLSVRDAISSAILNTRGSGKYMPAEFKHMGKEIVLATMSNGITAVNGLPGVAVDGKLGVYFSPVNEQGTAVKEGDKSLHVTNDANAAIWNNSNFSPVEMFRRVVMETRRAALEEQIAATAVLDAEVAALKAQINTSAGANLAADLNSKHIKLRARIDTLTKVQAQLDLIDNTLVQEARKIADQYLVRISTKDSNGDYKYNPDFVDRLLEYAIPQTSDTTVDLAKYTYSTPVDTRPTRPSVYKRVTFTDPVREFYLPGSTQYSRATAQEMFSWLDKEGKSGVIKRDIAYNERNAEIVIAISDSLEKKKRYSSRSDIGQTTKGRWAVLGYKARRFLIQYLTPISDRVASIIRAADSVKTSIVLEAQSNAEKLAQSVNTLFDKPTAAALMKDIADGIAVNIDSAYYADVMAGTAKYIKDTYGISGLQVFNQVRTMRNNMQEINRQIVDSLTKTGGLHYGNASGELIDLLNNSFSEYLTRTYAVHHLKSGEIWKDMITSALLNKAGSEEGSEYLTKDGKKLVDGAVTALLENPGLFEKFAADGVLTEEAAANFLNNWVNGRGEADNSKLGGTYNTLALEGKSNLKERVLNGPEYEPFRKLLGEVDDLGARLVSSTLTLASLQSAVDTVKYLLETGVAVSTNSTKFTSDPAKYFTLGAEFTTALGPLFNEIAIPVGLKGQFQKFYDKAPDGAMLRWLARIGSTEKFVAVLSNVGIWLVSATTQVVHTARILSLQPGKSASYAKRTANLMTYLVKIQAQGKPITTMPDKDSDIYEDFLALSSGGMFDSWAQVGDVKQALSTYTSYESNIKHMFEQEYENDTIADKTARSGHAARRAGLEGLTRLNNAFSSVELPAKIALQMAYIDTLKDAGFSGNKRQLWARAGQMTIRDIPSAANIPTVVSNVTERATITRFLGFNLRTLASITYAPIQNMAEMKRLGVSDAVLARYTLGVGASIGLGTYGLSLALGMLLTAIGEAGAPDDEEEYKKWKARQEMALAVQELKDPGGDWVSLGEDKFGDSILVDSGWYSSLYQQPRNLFIDLYKHFNGDLDQSRWEGIVKKHIPLGMLGYPLAMVMDGSLGEFFFDEKVLKDSREFGTNPIENMKFAGIQGAIKSYFETGDVENLFGVRYKYVNLKAETYSLLASAYAAPNSMIDDIEKDLLSNPTTPLTRVDLDSRYGYIMRRATTHAKMADSLIDFQAKQEGMDKESSEFLDKFAPGKSDIPFKEMAKDGVAKFMQGVYKKGANGMSDTESARKPYMRIMEKYKRSGINPNEVVNALRQTQISVFDIVAQQKLNVTKDVKYVKAEDGDTFFAYVNGRYVEARVDNLDAAEKGTPLVDGKDYYVLGTKRLDQLMREGKLEVAFAGESIDSPEARDERGRLLLHVTANSKDVGATMIKEGLAYGEGSDGVPVFKHPALIKDKYKE